jgi:hypothetical protein
MKSKVLSGLLAAALIVAFAPTSFAQIQVTLINSASDGEVAISHHAQTSDPNSPGAGILISGAFLAQANLTATLLELTFPAAITSGATAFSGAAGGTAVNVPSATDGIRLSGASGLFAGITAIHTIDYEDGTISIMLPAATNNTASGSVSLIGVRIDADDLSPNGAFEVTGQLSSSANGYLPTDLTADIIESLGDGFTAAIGSRSGTTNEGTISIFSNRVVADSLSTVLFTEPFDSAWRSAAQHSTGGGATNITGTKISLTFAGVPSGVTLTLATSISGTSDLTLSLNDTSLNSTDLDADITVTGSDLTDGESFHLTITASVPTATGSALATGDITVTAVLAEVGDPLDDATDLPTTSGGFPRFADNSTVITVGSIVAPSTNLLIPYAVVDNSILYDTGIALANTTLDPFTTGGATPASGPVKVTVFPRNNAGGAGTSFSFTTSATKRPGQGLSSDGTLAAGATWTVLLSAIMAQEGVTGPLTGYIIIETTFRNAHGITFISDFGAGPFNFTSFSPMNVMAPPSQTDRDSGTFEGLNF